MNYAGNTSAERLAQAMGKNVPLYVTPKGEAVLAVYRENGAPCGMADIVAVATCACGAQFTADHEAAALNELYEHLHESEAP
jgi:hypothetical protein